MAPITEVHGVPVYVSDVKEWQRAKKKKLVSPRSFFRFMAEKHGPTRWHFHFAARYPNNADAISRLAAAQRKAFADNEFAEWRANLRISEIRRQLRPFDDKPWDGDRRLLPSTIVTMLIYECPEISTAMIKEAPRSRFSDELKWFVRDGYPDADPAKVKTNIVSRFLRAFRKGRRPLERKMWSGDASELVAFIRKLIQQEYPWILANENSDWFESFSREVKCLIDGRSAVYAAPASLA